MKDSWAIPSAFAPTLYTHSLVLPASWPPCLLHLSWSANRLAAFVQLKTRASPNISRVIWNVLHVPLCPLSERWVGRREAEGEETICIEVDLRTTSFWSDEILRLSTVANGEVTSYYWQRHTRSRADTPRGKGSETKRVVMHFPWLTAMSHLMFY